MSTSKQSSGNQLARIAYLSAAYPAITHTFILREVLALRALGQPISTFAINRENDFILTDDDRAERASTVYLKSLGIVTTFRIISSEVLASSTGRLVDPSHGMARCRTRSRPDDQAHDAGGRSLASRTHVSRRRHLAHPCAHGSGARQHRVVRIALRERCTTDHTLNVECDHSRTAGLPERTEGIAGSEDRIR